MTTIITYDYIKKSPFDWQSHLQQIAPFLVHPYVYWRKTAIGIEFFDCYIPIDCKEIDENKKPKVHHFRSASIGDVEQYSRQQWSTILENNTCIPAYVIHEGDLEEPV